MFDDGKMRLGVYPNNLSPNLIQSPRGLRAFSPYKENDSLVVSDDDLDSILSDVEEYEEKKKAARKKKAAEKRETSKRLSPVEDDLDDIFTNVEKRRKEMEEILLAVEASNKDDDDKMSDCKSVVSMDNELEELMKEIEGDGLNVDNFIQQNNRKEIPSDRTKSEEELDGMVEDLLEF
ncbi:uncharacterized protein LOC116616557 [Nematostella vectensis]|uniref:uncharacterized protein LOC116616557 n=1 Tax=Nematostella vectensis TaxID=45351 RepID=UPI0020770C6E|nr:uncharacterized protein LOC116616557 [Nematostella vectensis]